MTSKLLAVNVFDDGDTPEQQTPSTNQDGTSTTPKTNDNTQKQTSQKTVQDASGGPDLTKDYGPNLLVMGSVFVGFLILVLLMLVIIRKLNKQK